jgi:intracellular sulfur oxidation DsrE/DsrF family protein
MSETNERLHVVVHVDDADEERQRLALRNITNLLADVGPENVEVELVFNGPAVSACLKGSPIGESLASIAANASVLACRNALRAADLDEAAVDPHVRVIPASITHLVRRQHEGWAYVRP